MIVVVFWKNIGSVFFYTCDFCFFCLTTVQSLWGPAGLLIGY